MKRLLSNLRCKSSRRQQSILTDLASSIHAYSSEDLQVFLGYLCSQNDIILEIKLLSVLSKCVTTNEYHNETIIKYEPLYDKLENIISRGLPLRTTHVLNFISALIYTNDEDVFLKSKSLAMLVRNMVRVSGCLRVMCTHFIKSMMYPETYKALCLCISLCCDDCDLNKAQCAHLIPECIEKCRQGLVDAAAILQSLLKNNIKHLNKFLSCNGLSIFTWEIIQNIKSLELLCTVVSSSENAAMSIKRTKIPQHLSQLLSWNGPQTKKGQWCKFILYYINKYTEGNDRQTDKQTEMIETRDDLNQINEDENELADHNNKNNTNNTMKLFSNVVKEVLYWKNTDERHKTEPGQYKELMYEPKPHEVSQNWNRRDENDDELINGPNLNNKKQYLAYPNNHKKHEPINNNYHDTPSCTNEEQLSFTFLQEEPERDCAPVSVKYLTRNPNRFRKDCSLSIYRNISSNNNRLQITIGVNSNNDEMSIDTEVFKPVITSTPKGKEKYLTKPQNDINKKLQMSVNNFQTTESRQISRNVTKISKLKQKLKCRSIATQFSNNVTCLDNSRSVIDVKNRSMTARFFTAVNESCTAFVKTVRDTFNPWKTNDSNKKNLHDKNNLNSANSFTSYMKRRDALMNNDKTHQLLQNVSCNTCNDTAELKNKLGNDEHLQKTVRKLKMGINLFGCDFKRISKTMWPQEEYMTPAVLYNLYRKLIIK